jgi:hypothetical protein
MSFHRFYKKSWHLEDTHMAPWPFLSIGLFHVAKHTHTHTHIKFQCILRSANDVLRDCTVCFEERILHAKTPWSRDHSLLSHNLWVHYLATRYVTNCLKVFERMGYCIRQRHPFHLTRRHSLIARPFAAPMCLVREASYSRYDNGLHSITCTVIRSLSLTCEVSCCTPM